MDVCRLLEPPDSGFRRMDAFSGGWLWIAAVQATDTDQPISIGLAFENVE